MAEAADDHDAKNHCPVAILVDVYSGTPSS